MKKKVIEIHTAVMPDLVERWTNRSIPIVQSIDIPKFPDETIGLCGWCQLLIAHIAGKVKVATARKRD